MAAPRVLLTAACVATAAGAAAPSTFGIGKSQFHISSAQETELFNYTRPAQSADLAASIRFFWLTGDSLSGSDRCGVDVAIWRFYVDGEEAASVALPTAQAAFVGNADTSAPWSNEWFGKNSRFGGWHVNVPIPFYVSIRVTLQLPLWWPSPTERIFAMVRGVDNLAVSINGFQLPAGARLVASVANSSLAPLDFHDLVSIPPGTTGLMLGAMIDMQLYGAGAGSLNSLEGCWHAHVPPTTPFPGSFLLGTGAEDYPES